MITLVPITTEIVAKVHRLDQQVADFPWSLLMFWEELGTAAVMRAAVGEDGEVVAYGVLRPMVEEWHLLTLGVSLAYRRQGLGKRLVCTLLQEASERGGEGVLLEVAENNVAARELYLSLGFKKIGRRRGYYKTSASSQDALVMSVGLPLGMGSPCVQVG